jgi:predicted GH43/DUF377 family glycosyl hydrolase
MIYWADSLGTESASRFGFAWSEDVITWTRHPQPVFEGGQPGTWDEIIVLPTMRVDRAQWEIWYSGGTEAVADPSLSLGRAVSSDGIHWIRDAANPLLVGGGPDSWNENLAAGNVFYDDSAALYRMYFHVIGSTWFQITMATSPDGESWTMHPAPVLGPGTGWDSFIVACPYVFKGQGGYKMYYHGSTGGENSIGYATSLDGVSWERHPYNPVITAAPEGAWDGLEVLCPNLFEARPNDWLFYGGASEWIGTGAIGVLRPDFHRVEMPFFGARGNLNPSGHHAIVDLSRNPFRDHVWVVVRSAAEELIAAPRVYDVSGRHIANLSGSGSHWLWNGATKRADSAAPGVYWIRIEALGGSVTRQIIKIR